MQLRKDWDLAADVHKPGWGIIYPLIVRDKHPDLQEYDKAVGLDGMVVGEVEEGVNEAEAQRKAKMPKRVKREQQQDDEAGGVETNRGIRKLSAELAAKKKKPWH